MRCIQQLAVVGIITAFTHSAHAGVFKCVVDGKTVFRDTPCVGNTGGEIKVNATKGSAPVAGQPSELEKTNAWVAQSEKERNIASLDRQISSSQTERENLQKQMESELTALRLKKGAARNNLAGATWEQSISTEMQAVTQRYDIKMRDIDTRLTDLKEQRKALN